MMRIYHSVVGVDSSESFITSSMERNKEKRLMVFLGTFGKHGNIRWKISTIATVLFCVNKDELCRLVLTSATDALRAHYAFLPSC